MEIVSGAGERLMTLRQLWTRRVPTVTTGQRTIPRLGKQSFRALALFAFVAADFCYGFRMARVDGHSMEPTFQPGQMLLVRRLNWPSPPLQVGEIVVFEEEGEMLVKRIVALPGQRPPQDSMVASWRAQRAAEGKMPRLVGPLALLPAPVPKDHLYVLGDNLAVSQDSRLFGPIPQDAVIGRVISLDQWDPQAVESEASPE
jgi:signal peptidase I